METFALCNKAGKCRYSAIGLLTAERAKYSLFSVPYRDDVIGFVVRNGDAGRIGLSSLKDVIAQDLVIGHVRGLIAARRSRTS